MAGGRRDQGGQLIGATDDLCLNVVQDPVHVHDLQGDDSALPRLRPHKLTYRYMGRDFRLTDVHGNIVKKMLA